MFFVIYRDSGWISKWRPVGRINALTIETDDEVFYIIKQKEVAY